MSQLVIKCTRHALRDLGKCFPRKTKTKNYLKCSQSKHAKHHQKKSKHANVILLKKWALEMLLKDNILPKTKTS